MKKFLIMFSSMFIVIIVVLGLFLLFKINQERGINRIKKEISMVLDYTNGKGNIDDIKLYINKKSNNDKYSVLEDMIDMYLMDVLSIYEEYYNIINSDGYNNILSVNKDNINNNLEYVNTWSNDLISIKDSLSNINIDNYLINNNEDVKSKYYELMDDKFNFDKTIEDIDSKLNDLSNKGKIIEFLINNNDYWNMDGKVIFNKRRIYNEFNELINNLNIDFNFDLINDTEGPVIIASNVVIYQDDYVNIENKVSCIDEVDDSVDCILEGSYNNQEIGTYDINIKAIDKSNNVSTKKISVIVKERESYNLPYVIHVIRNWSTTIVYGQDDNGDYTKIIGVYPCSPGAGTNTPVGTFYTRRGYEWGALFGGVYGQYSTIITGHVLFHSVPYRSTNKDDLIWKYYNRLGSKDSMGCVRLTVRDAKWIYDNCANGTMVKIYDGDLPSGISKPEAQKIDDNDPRRGWDPTDPDPNNPWNNEELGD